MALLWDNPESMDKGYLFANILGGTIIKMFSTQAILHAYHVLFCAIAVMDKGDDCITAEFRKSTGQTTDLLLFLQSTGISPVTAAATMEYIVDGVLIASGYNAMERPTTLVHRKVGVDGGQRLVNFAKAEYAKQAACGDLPN